MREQTTRQKKKNRVVTVQAWAKPKTGKLYTGRVQRAKITRRRLQAMIENLDPTQEGRLHLFECTLPPKPGNQASRFLLACGAEADTVGTKICLDDIEGVVVGMRFYPDPRNKSAMRIEFERLPELQKGDSDSTPDDKQSPPHAGSSESEKDESKWQL